MTVSLLQQAAVAAAAIVGLTALVVSQRRRRRARLATWRRFVAAHPSSNEPSARHMTLHGSELVALVRGEEQPVLEAGRHRAVEVDRDGRGLRREPQHGRAALLGRGGEPDPAVLGEPPVHLDDALGKSLVGFEVDLDPVDGGADRHGGHGATSCSSVGGTSEGRRAAGSSDPAAPPADATAEPSSSTAPRGTPGSRRAAVGGNAPVSVPPRPPAPGHPGYVHAYTGTWCLRPLGCPRTDHQVVR